MSAATPKLLDIHVLGTLSRDGRILFATRMMRLFAYGLVSVVLFLYLTALGFSEARAGLLLTLTLVGDTAVSLPVTTSADRFGRKRMLFFGAALMLAAGVVFVCTSNFWLLLLAATIGVISPSGNEVGPFLAIEQASLSQLLPSQHRTALFAWYNLAGSVATATGALAGGWLTHFFHAWGFSIVQSYRATLLGYVLFGGLLMLTFTLLSSNVEVAPQTRAPTQGMFLGLHRSRNVVLRLAALFSLDAFAGGFIVQSLIAYWFHVRFGADLAVLGTVFFGANLLAGISALTASRLAQRFGLINTMVFTHIPSNILLIMVPLMPNLPLAITVLLARFAISQMDVPTRQSYTMAVVSPDERSAAAGVTGVARTLGASISPLLAGPLLAIPSLLSAPIFIAGSLKIVYDLILWRNFRNRQVAEVSATLASLQDNRTKPKIEMTPRTS